MQNIFVYSHREFDAVMRMNGWNDEYTPDHIAYISICCHDEIKKGYLEKVKHETDEHWFKENHDNVLNIEFDDIQSEFEETKYGKAIGITLDDAKKIVDFLKKNKDKKVLYIHCRSARSRSVAVGRFASNFYNCWVSIKKGEKFLNKFVYSMLEKANEI